MKVKLLRRVFCVVMCVVVLACSSVNAFAIDLYGRNFKWANLNSAGDVVAYWTNLNLPSYGSSGALLSNLSAGADIWNYGVADNNIATPAPTINPLLNYIPLDIFTGISTGYIIHSYPSHDFWYPISLADNIPYAFTLSYSVLNEPIKEETSNICQSTSISYSLIYYNPYFYTSCNTGGCPCSKYADIPPVSWSSVVAHEIGHALGFGHFGSDAYPSIMRHDIKNYAYTALKVYDINDYFRKYP